MTYKFEDIIAWQKAHAFVLTVYKQTRLFPPDERFELTSQFRRAAVSIEANIAEGYKKLYNSLEESSRCLTSYCNAIIKNTGINDTIV